MYEVPGYEDSDDKPEVFVAWSVGDGSLGTTEYMVFCDDLDHELTDEGIPVPVRHVLRAIQRAKKELVSRRELVPVAPKNGK